MSVQIAAPGHDLPGIRNITMNNSVVGIKTVIVSIRHMFLDDVFTFRTARLDANPKNMPKASLSCHAERS